MLKFWNTSKDGDISQVMRDQLSAQYSIAEENLNGLQYASRSGKFVGVKTTYIRIFDPILLKNGVNLKQRYNDLTDHVGAILFEGRLSGGQLVDVFDRRAAN